MPVRDTVCGEPAALSATETVAAKLAAEAGVKVIAMEQLALAASDSPQVLVWAKSVGLAPVMVMELMLSAALPVFLSVAVWDALVEPVCAVKVSDAGVKEATGAGIAPKLAVTLCGAPMVTVVDALLALATLPVQLLNMKPAFGVAARFTVVPAAKKAPEAGETVPSLAGFAAVVN